MLVAGCLVALDVQGLSSGYLGDLDRVSAWLMVYGMVNAVAGFTQTTQVMNGFSDLILELYGPEVGRHARMSPGMMTLPLDAAVVIGAEVAIRP